MKSIISLKHILMPFVAILMVNVMFAQEIINEEEEVQQVKEVTKVDTTKTYNAVKVDGVAAVVGDFIVLESDVPKEREQIKVAGGSTEGVSDCELLGVLLERKLYAHHAIQDSIIVPDAEIRQRVEYTMQQFLQSTNGSMEKLLQVYGKEDEKDLRDEMFEAIKNSELANKMQAKIVEEAEITPEEVREFFNKIPKDKRPTFGTELKVAQIVTEPKVTEGEEQQVIDRLNEFRTDVLENGASFRSKVVLYGEDPGLKQNNYQYKINRNDKNWAKEFKQATFSLKEGEVSQPFKTQFGYHIVHCIKIQGQDYIVSHVLLMPKVSITAEKEAYERLSKVREKIVSGDISFANAAREVSDEKETKNDGGQLINPQTQDYKFDLARMDTELYAQIQNLKDGEISVIHTEQDRTGNKKYKILTVTDRIDEHEADYARDYLKIRDLALKEKQIKTIENWQDEKILDTYIKISGLYRDCSFSGNWLKK